jgi:hypothetical protein
MCQFYDTTVNNSCREPVAEKVTDKQRKNFCGYLQPSPVAYQAGNTAQADETRQSLDALFGLGSGDKADTTGTPRSADVDSRKKLDDLFNIDKKS